MKTPLAIYNLWHQGAKTVVSIGGVAFALLLVFMQLGFMGAVSHTATNVLGKLDCDIILRSPDYLHLYEADTIDRSWLAVAASTPGVEAADPFWILIQNWRKLPTADELASQAVGESAQRFESQYLPIAVMAFEPAQALIQTDEIAQQLNVLRDPSLILLDDATKPDYGPWDGEQFDALEDVPRSQSADQPERRPEIGGVGFGIGGLFELGTGLAANAAAIMGDRAFARISPWDTRQRVSLGLVRLEDNRPEKLEQVLAELRLRVGTDPEEVRALGETDWIEWARVALGGIGRVQRTGEVEVLSRAEVEQRERYRWLWLTPIGLIFQMGVVISLMVGAAIVYMVLSTDVANRLPEYATLLAMGYSRGFLAAIVMTQAMVLSILGFISAWGIAEILYRVTTRFSGIPLIMNPFVVALVGILGLFMCCVSGLLALRKLWKAEPASLF